MPIKGLKIVFLGGGNMGEALLAGLLGADMVYSQDIVVCDIDHSRLEYLKDKYKTGIATDGSVAVQKADIVILAVKPMVIGSLLQKVASSASPEQLFISIAAGVSTRRIESYLKAPVPVVRVMPNSPFFVGEGACAVSGGRYAGRDSLEKTMAIFGAAGLAVEVAESLMDCVTGLSGSGPAYMFLILEALVDGAVRLGMPRDTARKLAAQTMLGAARMVLLSGEHPGKLKDMVTTPGGTTMAGLYVLEEGALRALLMEAVAEAASRSQELSTIE